ncbi:hypothetical protein B0H34DRAFT_704130 [Crassisporium funariophilum]|nr:hypothetical protein B0H34DRAFT_704130 [Crassisporium funariophilum]
MEKMRGLAERHRATIASATKRATAAEQIGKFNESKLKERTAELKALQQRVELTRQCVQLSKELAVVLPKLDESKKKLEIMNDKANRHEVKITSLRAECDRFESQFQDLKKKYSDLIAELDSLLMN